MLLQVLIIELLGEWHNCVSFRFEPGTASATAAVEPASEEWLITKRDFISVFRHIPCGLFLDGFRAFC